MENPVFDERRWVGLYLKRNSHTYEQSSETAETKSMTCGKGDRRSEQAIMFMFTLSIVIVEFNRRLGTRSIICLYIYKR